MKYQVFFIYLLLTPSSYEDSSTLLLFSVVWTICIIFDVWQICHTCGGLMKEAHKAGIILHRVYLPQNVDFRFQQSVC